MLSMLAPKKKISSVLLEGLDGETQAQPEIQEDGDIAADAVAGKVLKAIESKDKSMLIDALRDAFTMIQSEVTGPEDMGVMNGDAG